jgi:hypothetical protein
MFVSKLVDLLGWWPGSAGCAEGLPQVRPTAAVLACLLAAALVQHVYCV